MASHVVVIDSSARRATVKTAPEKYLTDVLHEACQKLGRDANLYGLKQGTLDLSRNIRLSGLSSGAKLELILTSRSPSVVAVALQLPEPDSEKVTRLTDRFPSSTTLWLILRKFESEGPAGKRNFTARGVSRLQSQEGGAGRLFFETPVVQVMGRELASFTDLQKSLAQLGFNSGSALLRLSFRTSETPLEEAMEQIGQYFQEVESTEAGGPLGAAESTPAVSEPALPEEVINAHSPPEPESPPHSQRAPRDLPIPSSENPSDLGRDIASDTTLFSSKQNTTTGISHRPITVFAPPSSSTPKAAQQPFNERDYEPTVDHAKLHQSRLAATGTNKRLLSDAELSAQAEAQAKKYADVKEVDLKIRFPDQTQVVTTFSNIDTANSLYDFVKRLMAQEDEPFSLKFTAARGPKTVPRENGDAVKLIGGLGMVGKVLVNVVWEEGARLQARNSNVLKAEFQEKAREIEVQRFQPVETEEGNEAAETRPQAKEEKGKRGVPKWLKLPSKK